LVATALELFITNKQLLILLYRGCDHLKTSTDNRCYWYK
jgi:hypothetical protein